jgi:predicted nucleic acid-binding protein
MTHRLFLDTNIVLDLLSEREPFYEASVMLVSLADMKEVQIAVSALSFATVNYVLSKQIGVEASKDILRKFKILCQVMPIDETIIDKALNSDFKDFEDAIQYFSALDFKAHYIISRNAKDFKTASLPILSASEYLRIR